ncbi:MAG TPA: PH domain-containing protein [Thermoanaerobaculia bacterium]|nr:PH domain-containing protein [Thermoanaerobaculia bacterium]
MNDHSLLAIIDPILSRMLGEREEVLRVFLACSPSPLLERMSLGSGLQHLRRCIVAVTSDRIVLVAVARDLKPRDSVSQISFGDVASFTFHVVRRTMTIHFRRGTKQRFSDLSLTDVQALRDLLPPLIQNRQPTPTKERESLCACCLAVLRRGSQVCPHCHAPMKRRDEAIRLSWWWPGGGYGYLGFPEMATLTAIVESGIAVLFVLAAMAMTGVHRMVAATAIVALTILFLEWKSAVAAHAARLTEETIFDRDAEGDPRPTPADILLAAVRWSLDFLRIRRQNPPTGPGEYVWIDRESPGEIAHRLRAPRTEQLEGIAFRSDVAFVDEKWVYSQTEVQQTREALRSIGKTLRNLLTPGEQVLMISRGSLRHRLIDLVSPSVAFVIISRRCWYVFTTKRILRISNRRFSPRRSVRALPYSAIAAVRFDAGYWFGVVLNFAITLVSTHGAIETVAGLSVHSFEKLRAFLPPAIRAVTDTGEEPADLCPCCAEPLEPRVFACSRCAIRFREPRTAMLMAAIIPGGGYFFTGYWTLGLIALGMEVFLAIALFRAPSVKIAVAIAVTLLLQKAAAVVHAHEFASQFVSVDSSGVSPLGGEYVVA